MEENELIEMINETKISNKENKKKLLKNIHERLLYRHKHLLEKYLPSIIELAQDQTQCSKKFVLNFVEELMSKDIKSILTF